MVLNLRSSSYFILLSYTAQKRYLENLKIADVNLFAVSEDWWTENLSEWPDLKLGITKYIYIYIYIYIYTYTYLIET